MKKLIVFLFAYLFLMVESGCSSAPPPVRTRHSDPVMRISVFPKNISQGSYVRLQNALQSNGAWIVVDRANGFQAVDDEQGLEHESMANRFDAAERYARFGKLYGVGGIVVATEQCNGGYGSWSGQFSRCFENLSLINATTGEVMAVAEDIQDTVNSVTAPDWTRIVDKMTDNFPKRMINGKDPNQTVEYDQTLKDYRKQNETLY